VNVLDMNSLHEDYLGILDDAIVPSNEEAIIQKLIDDGEWTYAGAITLLDLAREHGTFMLRNALVLAYILGYEDGDGGM
jgi:hypothetical protein